MKKILIAIGLLTLLAAPALATDTAWQSIIMPTGRVMTVDSGPGYTNGCDFATIDSGGRIPACAPTEAFVFATTFPTSVSTQNGWQFRLKAQSGSTTAIAVHVCATFKAVAFVNTAALTDSDLDTAFGAATSKEVDFDVDDANPDTMLVTSWVSSGDRVPVYDADAAGNCSGDTCDGMEVLVLVQRVSTGTCASNELADGGATEANNAVIRGIDIDDGRGG